MKSDVVTREDRLARIFHYSLIVKGIDGMLECIGGLILIVLPPEALNRMVAGFTTHELSQDPRDLFASHLLKAAQDIAGHGSFFAIIYLLSHGLVKIYIVYNLLKHRLWAYPVAIAILWLFVLYQVYRIGYDPTLGIIALTIFDLAIIWLTYHEYRLKRVKFSAAKA